MFSLNSLNSMTKIFVITVKGFEPTTSSVRDQDATTAPARHMPNSCFIDYTSSVRDQDATTAPARHM